MISLPGMVEGVVIMIVVVLIFIPMHLSEVAGLIEKCYRMVFRD